ncbi:hypothetical protein [Rhizobium sp. BK176]|uniref:hypothetical protein n=1 Tax=Rhizobium sp. BK176 TaxID=2587071 RepID=UPI00216A8D61|nr:hypothetical protein [Rhizobium sp. BK176]MCS4088846.1 hypothetical protein [Rhizobium sp. BK176]
MSALEETAPLKSGINTCCVAPTSQHGAKIALFPGVHEGWKFIAPQDGGRLALLSLSRFSQLQTP